MYDPDSNDENPGFFTIAGILVVLLLGAGVFVLLYTSLATPNTTAGNLLSVSLTPETPAGITPTPSPPKAVPTYTTAPTVTATPTRAQTPTPAQIPTAEPSPTRPRPTRTPVFLRVSAGDNVLNIRRQPRSSSPIVQQLDDGNVVEDLRRTQTTGGVKWRKVRSKQGTVGWASERFLKRRR